MSELRANSVRNAAGTGPVDLFRQWASKAWLNLNGTGTIALRDSENISSVTDGGVGNYTQNFINSFANTGFATVIGSEEAGGANALPCGESGGRTVGSQRNICVTTNTRAAADVSFYCATSYGDLA